MQFGVVQYSALLEDETFQLCGFELLESPVVSSLRKFWRCSLSEVRPSPLRNRLAALSKLPGETGGARSFLDHIS